MDTKLTIRLKRNTIERAKAYARDNKTSLSKIIESYLDNVTQNKYDKAEITPLVKSLSGVMELPEGYEHKKDYSEYLTKKYK